MCQTNSLPFLTTVPIEASTKLRHLSVIEPCRGWNYLWEQNWFFSLCMIWCQRSCTFFAQRDLLSVVSAPLRLMGLPHHYMQRQTDICCFVKPRYSLNIFVPSHRCLILVGFATAFRATFCQRVENFHIKKGSLTLIYILASSSSVVVCLRAKVSPFNGWRWGSISTSWQTPLNKFL